MLILINEAGYNGALIIRSRANHICKRSIPKINVKLNALNVRNGITLSMTPYPDVNDRGFFQSQLLASKGFFCRNCRARGVIELEAK